ncbi:MAG: nucleoside recognition domain-containing protein [Bacteroidota bacterium]
MAQQIVFSIKEILKTALPAAFKTVTWLLSLMIPISLLVTLLQYYGIISWAAELLNPLFHYLGLSGQCAFVFLTSIFLNIYSAIAVISTLSLSMREICIVALMCLISHNMIIETIIQSKTGSSGLKMVFIRLSSSIIAALALNYLLPPDALKSITPTLALNQASSLWTVIEEWGVKMFFLAIKVILFVSALMILQQILEKSGIIKIISRLFTPLLKVMGLPVKTSFLWIVANVLGLAYGSAIMIDELEKGKISKEENNLLNHHVAVSHSLLEDTLLFMTIGVSAFWITIPRIILAIAVVWIYRMWKMMKNQDLPS